MVIVSKFHGIIHVGKYHNGGNGGLDCYLNKDYIVVAICDTYVLMAFGIFEKMTSILPLITLGSFSAAIFNQENHDS